MWVSDYLRCLCSLFGIKRKWYLCRYEYIYERKYLILTGGRIDMAHHETKARKALDETAEFAKAVEAALKYVNIEETLIVVTSDHSHTMSYSGYSKRGSDILGLASKVSYC
jgi:alkaline phosphatase